VSSNDGITLKKLRGYPLLRWCDRNDLPRARKFLTPVTRAAGEFLLRECHCTEGLYLLRRGTVRICRLREEARPVVIALRGPGETLGEISLIDNQTHTATVVTEEECALLWMPRKEFIRAERASLRFSRNLTRIVTRRFRLSSEQNDCLAREDIRGRICCFICIYAREYGVRQENGDTLIPMRVTQKTLSDMVGCSRERVNQVLRSLRKNGGTSITPDNRIIVHSHDKLLHRLDGPVPTLS